MKLMIPIAACLALAGVLASCTSNQNSSETSTESTASPKGASAAAPRSYPVIGHLAGRDNTISIKAGPRGPLYSVVAKDGRVLHQDLSAEQLQARAPEVYRIINDSMANDARRVPRAPALPVLDYDMVEPRR